MISHKLADVEKVRHQKHGTKEENGDTDAEGKPSPVHRQTDSDDDAQADDAACNKIQGAHQKGIKTKRSSDKLDGHKNAGQKQCCRQ